MKEYHQFYINGSWVDPINGLNKLDVLNPATEEPIGSIALGSSEDVNAAVDAAKNAFASFSSSEKEERVGYLEKIIEIYMTPIRLRMKQLMMRMKRKNISLRWMS